MAKKEKADWKRKAIEGAIEKKRLNKRIKELTNSRDGWRDKSIHHKKRADRLAADLKKIKNRLSELLDKR